MKASPEVLNLLDLVSPVERPTVTLVAGDQRYWESELWQAVTGSVPGNAFDVAELFPTPASWERWGGPVLSHVARIVVVVDAFDSRFVRPGFAQVDRRTAGMVKVMLDGRKAPKARQSTFWPVRLCSGPEVIGASSATGVLDTRLAAKAWAIEPTEALLPMRNNVRRATRRSTPGLGA